MFKIAVVQQRSINRNYVENAKLGIELIKKAKKLDADIVLFPECFITGYNLPINNLDAIDDNCDYINKFRTIAKELNIGIVITALTKGAVKPYNTAFIIDKYGEIILKYNKVHTCDFADEACLESGDQFNVCDFYGVKLGVMICYDREYPESARVLMLKGAEIILVPNDCYSMKPRLQALSTRAYENMVGIVMANPPGINAGCSCAYSPICWDKDGNCVDNTIMLADVNSTDIYIAEFDMDNIRKYRKSEMMGNTFRKVKAYGELLSSYIDEPFIR